MKSANDLLRMARLLMIGAAMLTLGACASTSFHAAPTPSIERSATWVVAPLINNTATPYAGQRAAQLVNALLAQRLPGQVLMAPAAPDATGLPLDNGSAAEGAARAFATRHAARYLISGSVDEWTYKIGLDGQPAVGFTLTVTDLSSGKAIWNGAASASGASREGGAVLAQDTLNSLIQRLLGK